MSKVITIANNQINLCSKEVFKPSMLTGTMYSLEQLKIAKDSLTKENGFISDLISKGVILSRKWMETEEVMNHYEQFSQLEQDHGSLFFIWQSA